VSISYNFLCCTLVLKYWEGRVAFISENHVINAAFVRIPLIENFFRWIDGFEMFAGKPNISWERDYPYNCVNSQEEYKNPSNYFTPKIAKKIEDAYSLKSELHWIKRGNNTRIKHGNTELHWVQDENALKHENALKRQSDDKRIATFLAYVKGSSYVLIYIFLILIGFPTLGATWPKDFRIWLLSRGDPGEEERVLKK
jgi:hypothetical protein